MGSVCFSPVSLKEAPQQLCRQDEYHDRQGHMPWSAHSLTLTLIGDVGIVGCPTGVAGDG